MGATDMSPNIKSLLAVGSIVVVGILAYLALVARSKPDPALSDFLSWECPELRDKAIGSLTSNELTELRTCKTLGY
jgi:hypothetical protein